MRLSTKILSKAECIFEAKAGPRKSLYMIRKERATVFIHVLRAIPKKDDQVRVWVKYFDSQASGYG